MSSDEILKAIREAVFSVKARQDQNPAPVPKPHRIRTTVEDLLEFFFERAGMGEYDGELSRADAEAQAVREAEALFEVYRLEG